MTEDAKAASAAELAVSLRLARKELRFVRRQQEADLEALQDLRRREASLQERLVLFSRALADLLAERYRDSGPPAEEAALVAEVEACELFDAAWYLRRHPTILEDGSSPAQHYVRTGRATGHDPGPSFDTESYLAEHPEARDVDAPALVQYLRALRP